MDRPHRPRWADSVSALAMALAVEKAGRAAKDAGFAFRDFGRWKSKARAHDAWGERVRVTAMDGDRPIDAVLITPALPSRRRSEPLARYDRLQP